MKNLVVASLVLGPLLAAAEPIRLRGSVDVKERSIVEDVNMLVVRDITGAIVFSVDDEGNITFSGTCTGCPGGGGAFTDPYTPPSGTFGVLGAISASGSDSSNIEADAGAGNASLTITALGNDGNALMTASEDGDSSHVTLSANGTGGETSSIAVRGPSGNGITYDVFTNGFHRFDVNSAEKWRMSSTGGGEATLQANGDADETIFNGFFESGWIYNTGGGNSHRFQISGTDKLQISETNIRHSTLTRNTKQEVYVADNGTGTAATFLLVPDQGNVLITCGDVHGCDGDIDQGDHFEGASITIVVNAYSVGVINFSNSSNIKVSGGGPITLNDYDVIQFIREGNQGTDVLWLQAATAVNN